MADEDQSRRNPRKLKDVLNFCTEVAVKADTEDPSSSSASSNAVTAMDSESKQYLSAALEQMVMDVPKQIAKCLKGLAEHPSSHEPEDDFEEQLEHLCQLHMLVEDHPDNANVVVDMGGLPVLLSCLEVPSVEVQAASCEVLGCVCQNNPKGQDALIKQKDALLSLLRLLDSNAACQVKYKALFTVSCLVRNSKQAAETFVEQDGLSYLLRALQRGDGVLYIKGIFLIWALTDDYEPCVVQLVSLGYIDLLVECICVEFCPGKSISFLDPAQLHLIEKHTWMSLKEHSTSALLKLCTKNEEALRICAGNEALAESLKDRKKVIGDQDEFLEEKEYITSLLALLSEKSSDQSQAPDEEASR
ncbi:Armadillo [Trinorchestia longiramus]|nr:Armadillo [Trinorchestia longiramus]